MASKTRKPKSETARAPIQQRSRARVEQILAATKELIAERGRAGLKIQDIADRANVTAGSIYQYFPNKSAIVQALGRQYMARMRAMLSSELSVRPNSLEEFVEVSRRLSKKYYETHRDDPVIRDIWMGTAVDKTLEDLDARDTQENTDLLFEHVKPFIPEPAWPEARRILYLSIELQTAAVRIVLKEGGEEGRRLYERAEEMMAVAYLSQLRALAQG